MTQLNPELEDMVMQKKLSPRKVRNLLHLKDFVDRLAQASYLPPAEIYRLEARFGVKPEITSWGDYFQTETASAHWEKPDADFDRIIQTIVFDLIAATLIFTGKSDSFMQQVEEASLAARARELSDWGMAEEDAMHLGILKNYFVEMQLDMTRLNHEDFAFFEQYADSATA